MSIFGKDDDEEYDEYLKDGSMFGKMDKEEWSRKQRRAEEISSGISSGMFERDEDIWNRVKELDDKK